MTNLASGLDVAAALYPDRPAVRHQDRILTYSEFRDLASGAAELLADRGVSRGDRVGLMLPNIASFPPLYYGILRLGAVVVPMNPLLRAREIEHHVRDSAMKVLLAHSDVAQAEFATISGLCEVAAVRDQETLEQLAERASGASLLDVPGTETAVILYTSGTTGAPKGAELTHDNLSLNASVVGDMLGLTGSDVLMGCLPLFHAFGQTSAMNASVVAKATLTLVTRFDPDEVLKIVENEAVSVFEGVPTMYMALLERVGDRTSTSKLRVCVSGGASLPGEVHKRFHDTFGAQILEGYGLSETSPSATFNLPHDAKVGSIGKPIPGVELRLVNGVGDPVPCGEIGEIEIRGHNVMKGYWKQPEATSATMREGWFSTGDLARSDEDGHYFIVGRKKEVIIRGGLNIYPPEVENVLYEHPAILEAAVLGVPDDKLGEEVAAMIVLRAPAEAEEVQAFVKARLAPYKYPRLVWFADELPKGATGKILKRSIAVPDRVQHS